MRNDITTAVTAIVTVLETERTTLTEHLGAVEAKLLAARSLLAPNGRPLAEPAIAAAASTPLPVVWKGWRSRNLVAAQAGRRTKQGGQWRWEQVRDYLAANGGGPVDFSTIKRKLRLGRSYALAKALQSAPRGVFELCAVPRGGHGFRSGVARAVRLVRPKSVR